jgi:hypothetical protein
MVSVLLATACGGEPVTGGGAAAEPPEDGGITIENALGSTEFGWIRGYLVARRGQPVLLCSAQPDPGNPRCTGASLILEDGVLWTVDNHYPRGTVDNGGLVNSPRDPESPGTGQPCAFGTTPDPCAAIPGLQRTAQVIWTERSASVLGGSLEDGKLTGFTDVEVR